MSVNPDHVLERADIARLATEFPHLEYMTVEGLYHHWVAIQGRLPEYDEILAYFRRVTGSLHEETIWEELFGIDLGRSGPVVRVVTSPPGSATAPDPLDP